MPIYIIDYVIINNLFDSTMSCIYKRSKYYAMATLNPQDIVQPIGYRFLNEEKKSVKPKTHGEAKNAFIVEKTLMRHISTLRTTPSEVIRNLKVSESARKNLYMSGSNTQNLTKESTTEMILDLRNNFFKNSNQELVEYLQLAILMHTSDYYLNIRDYALSTYFVYYHGENKRFYNQLESTLLSEFLEYGNEIIINSPKLSRPQLRKITNYEKIREIQEYIQDINEIGRKKDPFYTGLHLFIVDTLPQIKPAGFIQEQQQLWPFLQFTILVLMSTLAEGQNAIIKIKSTFTHKTSEYIFLLKMAFNRINFQKNIISNPFSHDKYVICQNFNKENGKIIANYLIDNYHLLFMHQDDRFLVDPKVTFTQDFQKNITTYNDSTPIMRAVKDIANDYHQNSNINIYPNKEALLKKISELKLKNFNDLCLQMQAIIPNAAQKKEEPKVKEIVEKQAVEINFDNFKVNDRPKKQAFNYNDISNKKKEDEIDAIANKYISEGNKSIQVNKEKKKQKKAEKDE